MGQTLPVLLPQRQHDDAALPTTMDGHSGAVAPTGAVDRVAAAVVDIVVAAAVDIVAVVGIEAVVDDNNTVAARESLERCCCWEGDNMVVVGPEEEALVHVQIHSCVVHGDTAAVTAAVTATVEGDYIRFQGQRIDRRFESSRVETWTKFYYWPTFAVATGTIAAVVAFVFAFVVVAAVAIAVVTVVFAPVEQGPAAGQTHPCCRLDYENIPEPSDRPIPEDPLHPAVSMPPDPYCYSILV